MIRDSFALTTCLLISTYFQGCPYKGCGKSYILHNSLQKHVTSRHSGKVWNLFIFFYFLPVVTADKI